MSERVPPNRILEAVQQRLNRLSAQRDHILRQLAEVDQKIAAIGEALGLSNDMELDVSVVAAPPAVDGRRSGSMVEFAVNSIAESEAGLTRSQIKSLLEAHPEFGSKIRANPNHLYNFVRRLIVRGELEERYGKLWLAGRAPQAPPQSPMGDNLFSGGDNV